MSRRRPVLLHLQHASLQFSDPPPQIKADLETILRRGAHLVSFTETTPGGILPTVRAAVSGQGYRLRHAGADVAFAVRNDVAILDVDYRQAHPGRPGLPRDGGHGPRGVGSITADVDGETVSLNAAHWVTGQREGHEAMTRVMIEETLARARGRRLSFFSGDVNVDEATDHGRNHHLPDWLFGQAGLTTVWDELEELRNTHGQRTIDVIGSCDVDGRVEALEVKRWRQLHTDHRQISAYYTIRRHP